MRYTAILLVLLLSISCSKNTTTPAESKNTAMPPIAATTPTQEMPTLVDPEPTQTGVITQAFTVAGPNTAYLEVDTQGKKIWIAVANMGIKTGDQVKFSLKEAMLMENFNSKFLNRTFDKVWFVQQIEVSGQTPAPVNSPKQ